MDKPFKDLKVVELAGVLAGPGVGFFFAELGADVIKIENKRTNGDVTRSWKLKSENPKKATSAYFWSVNPLKRHLFLNLMEEKDKQKVYKEIKTADIVITNYKLGDDKKLGVDYKTLKKIKPDIIYGSINGFGLKSNRTAYDLILQAESGYMYMNGQKESPPTKMPVALVDVLAGHQLKEALLIALLKRERTGKGSHVSSSLFESAISSLTNQGTNWLIAGHIPERIGSKHPNIAPYGELFRTKDKQLVTFAIGSNSQFKNLCTILSLDKLAGDKRFATNQNRIKNRLLLENILDDQIASITFKNLEKACLKLEVPFGKVRNMKEVFEIPESKSMLIPIKDDNKKKYTISSVAFRFHE
ncbi:MAG: CoA transferase [Flavobacteriales bacterium]|nr:CoA transferase [Flavobacteriales bacterium]